LVGRRRDRSRGWDQTKSSRGLAWPEPGLNLPCLDLIWLDSFQTKLKPSQASLKLLNYNSATSPLPPPIASDIISCSLLQSDILLSPYPYPGGPVNTTPERCVSIASKRSDFIHVRSGFSVNLALLNDRSHSDVEIGST
jgi:hypothetical protein